MFDVQLATEGIVHKLRSLDMAGRAGTHTDDVFSYRSVPVLGIKGRNAGYRGRRYLRDFAYPSEGFLGKIAVFLLNGMQDRDNIAGLSADFFDNILDKRKDTIRLLFHDRPISLCSTNVLSPGCRSAHA